jgi:phytoene synthase
MPARSRLVALLALDLELARIPHTVSEPALAQMRLQWWREALDEARQGRAAAHPVAQALAETGAAGCFSSDEVEALFAAYDSEPSSIPGIEMRGAAHGGLALDALGIVDEPTRLATHHIGSAWALVSAMRMNPSAEAATFAAEHLAVAATLPTERAARPALLPGVLAKAYLRRPQARLTPFGRQLRLMLAYAFG